LAERIDWDGLEKDFVDYYSKIGRPAVPVRKIVAILILEKTYIQSDKSVIAR
jgi:hypothetical protein